jgi:hypothetical protein
MMAEQVSPNGPPPDTGSAAPAPPSTPDIQTANAPTVEQPAVASNASAAQQDYEAERARLQDEIERQDKIITQFEQMQQMFGAAAPAAVTQGLAEARDAKERAESAINTLQPPPPPQPAVDPAEVKRLQDEIERQDKIISQFEQMQQMFGAAAPAAVTQGLAEARDAKARTEAELATLGGGASAAPAPPVAPAAAVPPQPAAPAAAQVAQTEVQLGELGTVPAPAAVVPPAPQAPEPAINMPVSSPSAPPVPVAPPQPAAPRMVFDDGKELVLPADKREIIIGREDPISGIFPEIDLTPYGGESGGVSRQHARINRANGQWTVTDLNSTNYTRVDGNKLDPSLPAPIRDGSRIQFGRVAATFRE